MIAASPRRGASWRWRAPSWWCCPRACRRGYPAQAASSAELFLAELRTRACENLLYVAACNRAGVEEFEGRSTLFFGQSCVIGPGGTVVAQGPADVPGVVHAAIDLDEVGRTRERLPLLVDRRPDAYVRLQREGACS